MAHLVVVGASLAGLRAAEAARRVGHSGPLTLVGAETHRPYDRPPLSKQVLTRRIEPAGTALDAADDLGVDWRLGTPASGIDLNGRAVTLADGDRVDFDLLVIATGAHPRHLPDLPRLAGVQVLRTLDDAVALRDALVAGTRLVVIGAGFVGLEVAASAVAIGAEVTVVEAAPLPLARAFDAELGALMAEWHREHGVDVRLRSTVAGLEATGDGRVAGVVVRDADGAETTVPADVVVIGIGVAPSTGWLADSGLDVDDGLRTDRRLRVLAGGRPLDHVVAAGDVVRCDDPDGGTVRAEHWTGAAEQGARAAATLLGSPDPDGPPPVPYFWSDQYDRKVQMVGTIRPGDETAVVDGSVDSRKFVIAYGRQGRLVAAVGFSRPGRVMALQRSIAAGAAWPLAD